MPLVRSSIGAAVDRAVTPAGTGARETWMPSRQVSHQKEA